MKYVELSCIIVSAWSPVSLFLKVMVKMEVFPSCSHTPLVNDDDERSHKILPILPCMSYGTSKAITCHSGSYNPFWIKAPRVRQRGDNFFEFNWGKNLVCLVYFSLQRKYLSGQFWRQAKWKASYSQPILLCM